MKFVPKTHSGLRVAIRPVKEKPDVFARSGFEYDIPDKRLVGLNLRLLNHLVVIRWDK
jgi:hypothetical protein